MLQCENELHVPDTGGHSWEQSFDFCRCTRRVEAYLGTCTAGFRIQTCRGLYSTLPPHFHFHLSLAQLFRRRSIVYRCTPGIRVYILTTLRRLRLSWKWKCGIQTTRHTLNRLTCCTVLPVHVIITIIDCFVFFIFNMYTTVIFYHSR